MTKNRFKWSAIATALVAASLASGLVFAADEVDSYPDHCNNTIAQAQPLEFDGSGVAVIKGTMINGYAFNNCDQYTVNRDIDVYSFRANAGEDFDIAISNAWNGTYTWTVLGVFGSPDSTNHYPLLRYANIGPMNPDGSYNFNPVIDGGFHANAAGTYYVAVSSQPGAFANYDATLLSYTTYYYSPDNNGVTDGTYTLTVKGAKPSVLTISIDVKPGKDNLTVLDASGVQHPAALRGVAKGSLPVALLSSEDGKFDATKVDQSTLRFGSTGKEDSLVSCNGGRGTDVNHDGKLDLICHFDMQKANFALSENEGTITGKTGDGKDFEGHGWLKIVTLGLTPENMGRGHK